MYAIHFFGEKRDFNFRVFVDFGLTFGHVYKYVPSCSPCRPARKTLELTSFCGVMQSSTLFKIFGLTFFYFCTVFLRSHSTWPPSKTIVTEFYLCEKNHFVTIYVKISNQKNLIFCQKRRFLPIFVKINSLVVKWKKNLIKQIK
ncbi:MAG: hypothetical protein A2007_05130 [Verrucomicrobia bacterium GWC2_42_7]|nr:MAG: hypothetical protein A2007_05130 [Verrucomicrobia bacterium GWC2_42_7]